MKRLVIGAALLLLLVLSIIDSLVGGPHYKCDVCGRRMHYISTWSNEFTSVRYFDCSCGRKGYEYPGLDGELKWELVSYSVTDWPPAAHR